MPLSPFRPRRRAAILLLLALGCATDPADPVEPLEAIEAPAPSPPVTPEEAVADFEAAWTAIDETHFDPEFNGVDWQGVHDELLPRARAAATRDDVRGVIADMLGRLGQSHFSLIPHEALPPATGGGDGETPEGIAGGCGFDVRLRDDRLLVWKVNPGGAAAQAGVRTGWLLRQVGDLTLEAVLEDHEASREQLGEREVAYRLRQIFIGRTYGEVGSAVELVFLDDRDEEVRLELERRPRDVIAHAAAATLPTFYLEFDSEIHEVDGRRIGWIHFTNWFLPMASKIDEAVDRMRTCDGIVIDLRGNGGGAAAMCMGLAGHFFDEKTQLGTMRLHDNTLKFIVRPRRVSPARKRVDPFAGPLAILVDETSGSASEIFSGTMQSVGRARVFGETSAGAVLGARMTSLPSGDAILHAMVDFETADGTHFEARGVIPDEVVPLRRGLLLAGEDPQLQAAIRWLVAEASR